MQEAKRYQIIRKDNNGPTPKFVTLGVLTAANKEQVIKEHVGDFNRYMKMLKLEGQEIIVSEWKDGEEQ